MSSRMYDEFVREVSSFSGVGGMTDPEAIYMILRLTLRYLQQAKPYDGSDMDRRFAIVITDFEKVLAYWSTYATTVTLIDEE